MLYLIHCSSLTNTRYVCNIIVYIYSCIHICKYIYIYIAIISKYVNVMKYNLTIFIMCYCFFKSLFLKSYRYYAAILYRGPELLFTPGEYYR